VATALSAEQGAPQWLAAWWGKWSTRDDRLAMALAVAAAGEWGG
jgi:hypothetical protein